MRRREFLGASCSGAGAVLARASAQGGTGTMTLLSAGESAQVVALPDDMGTAGVFVKAFEALTGSKLEVSTRGLDAGHRAAVLIGDIQSNPQVRRLAGPRISGMTSQSILLAAVSDGGRPILLVAGGSRAATPGAVGELLNYHLEALPGRAWVRPLDLVDTPALPYRILWNWDHSTNWVRGVPGEQAHGCRNPYKKPPGAYLNDFRRVVDYMAEHKLNGLILWGFLRDSHGGVSAAKELAQHAADRGVRVLPGIGTSHYGGFYYDGNHPFRTNTWLEQGRKGLRFLDVQGQRLRDTICPTQPENERWLREGARWLFTEIPGLGGANLENGDWMSCQCPDCKRSRARLENDPNYYFDMMHTQLPIIEEAWKLAPGAWMTYATYTGFNAEEMWKRTDKTLVRSKVPRFVSQYPEAAVCQWTYTYMVDGWGRQREAAVRAKWPAGLRPPTKHSIGLLHQGSQWHDSDIWWTKSLRGESTGERYVDVSELIRYTCSRCAEEGLEGIEIQGEVSDESPANELNYLAFEEFTWHPRRGYEEFVRDRLSRIYGGHEEARRYVACVRSEERDFLALRRELDVAHEMSQNRQFNYRQRCRWANLRAELARRISLL
jgi:hypothetical protein